ncbi:MAG TPA: sigma-70 family RNA polymerase sigma factor [Verrucomicrobiae bacterium]|nr:sigma-70 family RNA polymerase sigma factor [Verrucomicrobiae bacterium]
MTDQELLRNFVRERSESAFAELVGRHLPLVYSAALRQMSGDVHASRDVSQWVFSDFARKAPSLSENVVLAGWLHRATIFAARQMMRSERRRQLREQEAASMNTTQSESDDADWRQIHPLLDEALDHLDKTDRDALLLRFFQQQSFAEVGASLGGTEEAARKRAARALEKLRFNLQRRGVTTTAAALSTTIPANAMQPVPASLAGIIAHSSFAAAGTGTTFALLKIMTATSLRIGLGALVTAGVAATIVIQHQTQTRLRDENESLHWQIAQLQNNNDDLSSQLDELKGSRKMSDDQFNDLMRLRSEVGILRQRTNEQQQLQASIENSLAHQAAMQQSNSAAERQRQFAIAKINNSRGLVTEMVMYASDHQGQFPTGFDQVWAYTNQFPSSTTNGFEIVYHGSGNQITNLANVIVMQESQAWQTYDGKWAKVYGFADGHSELHVEASGDFSDFEQRRSVSLPVGRQ